MTTQDLRQLAEAATPGEWTTEKPGKDADGFSQGMIIAAVGWRGHGIYGNPPCGSFPEADRRFIAAANPATIIALCDQLDAQAAEIARMKTALEPFANAPSHGIYGGPMVQAKLLYEDGTSENTARHRGAIPPTYFARARAALKGGKG